MEECIVSINRLAAVYLYKCCKWKYFIYIVGITLSSIGILGVISMMLFHADLIRIFLPGNEIVDFKDIFFIFLFFALLSCLVTLVASLLGLKCVKQCEIALLAGDEQELENALFLGRVQSKILGISLLSYLSLLIVFIITVSVAYYVRAIGI